MSLRSVSERVTEGLVSLFSPPPVSVWLRPATVKVSAAADGAWLSLFLCFLCCYSTPTALLTVGYVLWSYLNKQGVGVEAVMYIKAKEEQHKKKKKKTKLVMFVSVFLHVIVVLRPQG